jgi:putative DNA primase/helicase
MRPSDEIRQALAFVPAHDRKTWVNVGMAIKSELGEDGFDLWSEWSQSDESYNATDARSVWRSISPSGGVTIRSLYGTAINCGWTPPKRAEAESDRKAVAVSVNGTRKSSAEDERHYHEARQRAVAIWEASDRAPDTHPYLVRKGIKSHGVKVYRGNLVIRDMHCDGALIVPLRNSAGDIQTLEFISAAAGADGKTAKRFLPGGRKSGGYHAFGELGDTVVIAEGYATGSSIYEATGAAVAIAFDVGNLRAVAQAVRQKVPSARLVLAADNDISTSKPNVGMERAIEAARAVDGLVAVPELDGRGCDFNDLALVRGAEAVRAGVNAARTAPEGSVSFGGKGSSTFSNAWPEPKELTGALPAIESFTSELLPEALQAWVMDIAERTQAPVEYVAVSAMVSLGAALGRKIAVRPRRRDDWQEFANLWGAVIGPPSWMKSPALDEGKRPLAIIEARMLEGYEVDHREWEAESEAAKVKRDGAKDRARKAARSGKSFDKMELVAATIPEEPRPARLIVNDATVPALCDVLRANPDGVLVFRDELAGLIAELDREGMEGSRGFYLTGWSGKDGHTQDRIARGTNLRVPYVCLSLLGGIQPARVAPLLRESIATGGGDGFLARFSLLVWPDSPGEYQATDREPDVAARAVAHSVYRVLHELEPGRVGAEMVDGEAPFLRFEPVAAELFTEWDVELRNRLRAGGEDGALAAHLGKYPKAISALALLTHLADGGTGDISVSAVTRALAWSELLESHARRVYASLGQAHIEAARSLLTRLRRGDLGSPFTLRDVYRRGWAHLPDAEAARAAADVLEAHHHLRSVLAEPSHTGGRPSMAYHLNPAVRS